MTAMSSDATPSVVTVYAWTSGGRVRAARFRWSPGEEVTLEILEPQWSGAAQEIYDKGVPLHRELRAVRRQEAELFMRALLEPRQHTFYQFIDESSHE